VDLAEVQNLPLGGFPPFGFLFVELGERSLPHVFHVTHGTSPCTEGGAEADVPFFVEHCEAVAAEIDVKQRWLGEQARRGRSVWSGALPGRHVMLEVACEPSVVGSL
jgi:hypothetical protein